MVKMLLLISRASPRLSRAIHSQSGLTVGTLWLLVVSSGAPRGEWPVACSAQGPSSGWLRLGWLWFGFGSAFGWLAL